MGERSGYIKLLGMFVVKEPIILYPYLSTVVDSMIKSLDPNIPHMRENLLPSLTATSGDLVKIYPCVAFTAHQQRLVIGNMDGTCILYDVRTATKLQILEVNFFVGFQGYAWS